MRLLSELTEAILIACPIDGISKTDVGIEIQFKPEATQEQRAAALQIAEEWDWDQPSAADTEKQQMTDLLSSFDAGTATTSQMQTALAYAIRKLTM